MDLEEAARVLSNDEFETFHVERHPELVDGCDVCRLSTIQLSASLHAERNTRPVKPRTPDNPWERGVTGEHRADGSFMPYIGADYAPISTKQFANRRGHLEAEIRANHEAAAAPVAAGTRSTT